MGNNKKSNSFVMQAGILAAAGIICKVIGILYRIPLAAVIGDEGMVIILPLMRFIPSYSLYPPTVSLRPFPR